MYKWRIDIILKSGKEIAVYYQGNENTSNAVIKKVLDGDNNTFNGFGNEDGNKNIFVKVGEIAVVSISA